jgi:hypothetical protein
MSLDTHVASSVTNSSTRKLTAEDRLKQLQKSLQRQLKRRPTTRERAALDRCAWLQLRSEMACRDVNADANTIVRLANVARRALQDFEEVCALPKRRNLTMGEVLRGR